MKFKIDWYIISTIFLAVIIYGSLVLYVKMQDEGPSKHSLERENLELSIEIKRKLLTDSTYYNECVNLLRTMEK